MRPGACTSAWGPGTSGSYPQALASPLRCRAQLPADGTGAGADDLAQPGVALSADGRGAANREYVDSFALDVHGPDNALEGMIRMT